MGYQCDVCSVDDIDVGEILPMKRCKLDIVLRSSTLRCILSLKYRHRRNCNDGDVTLKGAFYTNKAMLVFNVCIGS